MSYVVGMIVPHLPITVREKGIDLEVTASIYSHITEARKKRAARSGKELYDDDDKQD